MRYVGCIGARQSSAGSVTYGCFASGTGLLRTCNVLRIAGLPVLRNDGGGTGNDRGGRFAYTRKQRERDITPALVVSINL
ncbi:MAG: hypothetical protein LBM98_07510 [Oscillospiraceae bacterium]|nr:hypothetical protein [Oscillospiraceae bacterium]